MTYRLFAPARRVVRAPSLFLACGFAACAASPPARRRRPPPAPGAAAAAAPTVPAPPAPAARRRLRRSSPPRRTGTRRRPTARPASTRRSCPATSCSTTPTSRAASTSRGRRRSRRPAPATASSRTASSASPSPTRATTRGTRRSRHREMIIQKGHVYSIKLHGPLDQADPDEGEGRDVRAAVQGVLDRHRRSDDAPADVRRRVHDGRGRRRDRRVRVPLRRAERRRHAAALHGLLRRHAPRRSEVREAEGGGGRGADPRA